MAEVGRCRTRLRLFFQRRKSEIAFIETSLSVYTYWCFLQTMQPPSHMLIRATGFKRGWWLPDFPAMQCWRIGPTGCVDMISMLICREVLMWSVSRNRLDEFETSVKRRECEKEERYGTEWACYYVIHWGERGWECGVWMCFEQRLSVHRKRISLAIDVVLQGIRRSYSEIARLLAWMIGLNFRINSNLQFTVEDKLQIQLNRDLSRFSEVIQRFLAEWWANKW